MKQENKKNREWPEKLAYSIGELNKLFVGITREIVLGFKYRTIPTHWFAVWSIFFFIAHWLDLDYLALYRLGVPWLYPSIPWLYWSYVIVIGVLLPYLAWGGAMAFLLKKMLSALTQMFHDAGLVTVTGRIPSFISDKPIEPGLRELSLYMNGIPKKLFEEKKLQLETALHAYIDDIREERTTGALAIRYSRATFPEHTLLGSARGFLPDTFVIGDTRLHRLTTTLRDCPHLLIGGATNSGKSTALRQILAVLYLNNPTTRFWMTDLKGGMEAYTFKSLDRVEIHKNQRDAIGCLEEAARLIIKRAEFFEKNQAKNIDDYQRRPRKKETIWTDEIKNVEDIHRIVIVIDEAAELFLAGHLSATEVQKARRFAITIAAQGRAVGIHLIVAMQRPDAKALDMGIKANLLGRLCFYMSDNASSMTILDSVRAADLNPGIKGRAIWRSGSLLTEIQVPELSEADADKLFLPHKDTPKVEQLTDVGGIKPEVSGDPNKQNASPDAIETEYGAV